MTWRTLVLIVVTASALGGCVSYPNTKALITPFGAVGIHSFAPPSDTVVPVPKESERLANLRFQSESNDPE